MLFTKTSPVCYDAAGGLAKEDVHTVQNEKERRSKPEKMRDLSQGRFAPADDSIKRLEQTEFFAERGWKDDEKHSHDYL